MFVLLIPTDIAGLEIWLKADAETGLTDNGDITTLTDQSGAAANLTYNVGTKAKWKENITVGGLPVYRCPADNTADYRTAGSPIANTERLTFFVIAKSGGDVVTALLGDASNQLFAGLCCSAVTSWTTWSVGTGPAITIDNATTAFKYYVVIIDRTTAIAGTMEVRQNGVSKDVSTSAVRNAFTNLMAFATANASNQGWDGDVLEWGIYNVAVAGANLTGLETYLNNRLTATPEAPLRSRNMMMFD